MDEFQTDDAGNQDSVEAIVATIKAERPGIKLFQICIPEREDEIYIARKAPWKNYKQMVGQIKDESQANEVLVQKFLVYPKPDYEMIQEMDPGLVMTLAAQIQKGMGFTKEASLKNW